MDFPNVTLLTASASEIAYCRMCPAGETYFSSRGFLQSEEQSFGGSSNEADKQRHAE